MAQASLGLIYGTEGMGAGELLRFARRAESLGYDALWLPELFGREPFATAGWLLAQTETLRVGCGIANVYARDAVATAQGRHTLGELSAGRFLLGLGVSHPPMAQARGHAWMPPVSKLRDTLAGIAACEVDAPTPPIAPPIWIAAHGPRLLELAAERAQGALTYLMSPAHTARARSILGPDKALGVVMWACRSEDEARARSLGRRALRMYQGLPAYHRAWRDQGLEPGDWEGEASDRLLDQVGGFGSPERARELIEAHRSAGASHVIVSPLNAAPGEGRVPDAGLIEALAPGPKGNPPV